MKCGKIVSRTSMFVATTLALVTPAMSAPPDSAADSRIHMRIEALLARMTPEEKAFETSFAIVGDK